MKVWIVTKGYLWERGEDVTVGVYGEERPARQAFVTAYANTEQRGHIDLADIACEPAAGDGSLYAEGRGDFWVRMTPHDVVV